MSPIEFVEEAERLGCEGTSISFNEPTLMLEWSIDVFKEARRRGLYNTFVSNGYMTLKAAELLVEAGLDAINIDVKGGGEATKKYCGADVDKVWRNAEFFHRRGVHTEITVLVIPGVNDDEKQLREICQLHREKLGEDTPIHFNRYYPAYKFHAPPTPLSTLEKAKGIALEEGLRYVYLGNVMVKEHMNTYCHNCGFLVVERDVFSVVNHFLDEGNTCPKCGAKIPIVGEVKVSRRGYMWL